MSSKSVAQALEAQLNPSTAAGITLLKEGNLSADGTEQTLLEFSDVGRISGYVDLSEMGVGDTVYIRQYVLVNGVYQRYASEPYTGIQADPAIYITPKETDKGLRITLQQTAGTLKNYDNRFTLER